MYVCLCNGLNERRVREAVANGAASVAKVYKHHGCAPRCGKCLPVVREILVEAALPPAVVPSAEAAL